MLAAILYSLIGVLAATGLVWLELLGRRDERERGQR